MIIFIPIKEVSQRVPKKNFRSFCGKPLYEHTLCKLKNFKVYVDTDSNEILDNIRNNPKLFHVSGHKRDEDLVGHEIPVCALIESFVKREKIQEPICQIHVTSPFLEPNTIFEAQKILEKGHDSVVSCTKLNTRLWRKENYGMCPINHNPLRLEQTQDLPALYEENSLFYMFNPEVVLRTGNRIGNAPYFFETQFPEYIDIDTEEDWEMAVLIEENRR